jgi:hypothetical protein
MKSMYTKILFVFFIALPGVSIGQNFNYWVDIERMRSDHTGDGPLAGYADITWRVEVRLLWNNIELHTTGETCKHRSEYTGGWISANYGSSTYQDSSPPFNNLCGSGPTGNGLKVQVIIKGWENDGPNECGYGSFDDNYEGCTITAPLTAVCPTSNEYNSFVFGTCYEDGYEVDIKFKYTMDVLDGLVASRLAINDQPTLGTEACVGENYKVVAKMLPGLVPDQGYFEWQRKPVGSNTWQNVANGNGFGKTELYVTAESPGYLYRVRSVPNSVCLGGDPGHWQETDANWSVQNAPPVFTVSDEQTCPGEMTGALIVNFPQAVDGQNYTVSHKILGGSALGSTVVPGNMFPHRIENLGQDFYLVTVNVGVGSGRCGSTEVGAVFDSRQPTVRTYNSDQHCFGIDGGYASISCYYCNEITLTGPQTDTTVTFAESYFNYQNFFRLPVGVYTAQTAREPEGCTSNIATFEIMSVDSQITANVITTNAKCFGEDGKIVINGVSGGHPANQYWVTIEGEDRNYWLTNQLTFHRPPGTYTVSIRDQRYCRRTYSNLVITAPAAPVALTLDTINPTGCMPEGAIIANATGGTPPYQFKLNDDYQMNDTFPDLSPGYYGVRVKDANNCQEYKYIKVESATAFEISADQTAVTCMDSATAQITASFAGGSQPYQFQVFYQDDPTAFFDTMTMDTGTITIGGLVDSSYRIRVADMDNCVLESNVTITELSVPELVGVSTSTPDCHDDPLTQVEIEIAGRSDGQTSNSPMSITPNNGATQNRSDFEDNGNYSTYRFTVDTAVGTFTVRDQYGCPIDTMGSYTIPLRDSIKVELFGMDSVLCPDGNEATLTCVVSGGTPPYTVVLEELIFFDIPDGTMYPLIARTEIVDGPDTIVFTGLTASVADNPPLDEYYRGGYSVKVTDSLGCSGRSSDRFNEGPNPIPPVNIYQVPELQLTLNNIGPDLNCARDNGVIHAQVTGGTPPYEFSTDETPWQSSDTLSNTGARTDVYVRDANGCIVQDDIDINDAPNPLEILDPISISEGSECSPRIDSIPIVGATEGFEILEFGYFSCAGIRFPSFNERNNGLRITSYDVNYIVYENFNPHYSDCNSIGLRIIDSAQCIDDIYYDLEPKFHLPHLRKDTIIGISCTGESDGSITYSIYDEEAENTSYIDWKLAPPFTVILNGSATQMVTDTPYQVTFNNLPRGIFSLTVQDSFGCSWNIVDSLRRLYPYDYDIINSPVSACGTDSTGQLAVIINGGNTLPYNWTWFDEESGSYIQLGSPETLNAGDTTELNDLPVSTYKAVVSDQNNCLDTLTFVITGPPILSIFKTDSINPSCNGVANGAVFVNSLGGAALPDGTVPRFYSIDNGGNFQSDSFFTGLAAGEHTVLVQDGNGCVDSLTFFLTQPSTIEIDSVTIAHVSCFGGTDGRLEAYARGGSGSLQYALDGGTLQSSAVFSNLPVGVYQITIQDDNMCQLDTMNLIIMQPTVLASTIDIIDSLTCSQLATLVVSASGGSPGYSYSWNGGASSSDTLYNAGPGPQVIEIMDVNACVFYDTIELSLPEAPMLFPVADTADACNQSNGSFAVQANGGLQPYNFTANNESNSTGYFSGLSAGIYEVIVTDDRSCADTIMVTIDSVEAPAITQIDTVQTTCAGDNGSIDLTISNGSPPLTYRWAHDTTLNAPMVAGLGIGTYDVTISDVRACFTTASIEITETSPPILSVNQEINSSCGQDNGMAIVNATGGNPGYSFRWSHDTTLTGPSAMNLAPATYLVIVTDQNSCKDSANVIIGENPGPALSILNFIDESCDQTNGAIFMSATSGTRPFTYTWSHNGGLLDSTATNLAAGSYQITVTDVNNCTDTISVTLNNTPGPNLSVFDFQDNLCPDGNGFIHIQANGGTPGYAYAWSPNTAFNDTLATGLIGGTYQITVTDQNNCTSTTSQMLTDDNILSGSITGITETGCDTTTGQITISVTGGSGPYNYVWSHDGALDTNQVDSLGAGMYTVTVTDILGCEILLDTTITSAAAPAIMLASTTNSYCGPNMGAAIATATGGTRPFNYEWSNSASIDSFALNLPGGPNTVLVRDANNCTDVTGFVLDESMDISLSIGTTTDETCEDDNGSITVVRSGGTNPLTYSWSHDAGLNNATANNLSSGTYIISVMDQFGCMDTTMATIDSLPSPILSVNDSRNNSCDQNNGYIHLATVGGNPGFTYTWSHDASLNGPDANNLPGGTYSITVTDAASCTDTTTVTIANDPTLMANEVVVTPSGCTGNTGSITAAVDGGVGPYAYLWNHDNTLMDSIATSLAAGLYTLQVTDMLGCSDTIEFNVPMAPTPYITLDLAQPNTCGSTDGQISVTTGSGTPPYTYAWSHDGSITDSIAVNLMDGTYGITVTDEFGCTDTLIVNLPCYTSLTLSLVDTIGETCSQSNGQIIVETSGGTPPYTYVWSHDGILDTTVAAGLSAGNYSVTVTDAINATATVSAELSNTPGPNLTTVDVDNNNCPTGGNGQVVVTSDGGTPPFTFAWNHNAMLDTTVADGLVAGNYVVTITDSNGCQETASATIVDENLLTLVVNDAMPTGCNLATGSLVVSANLGRSPYQYAWSHDATLADSMANDLPAGPYTISVTDVSGCTVTLDTTISTADGPEVTLHSKTNSTCGLPNGQATISVDLGVYPYDYAWSHDMTLTDSFAVNLPADAYTVTVTDANACTNQITVTIDGSPPVNLEISAEINETCGLSNGSIEISVLSGTAPYNFSWNHDASLNDSIANGLSAGTYQIVVTDGLGCDDSLEVTLINLSSPTISLVDIQHNSCLQANGKIAVGISNGTPPFSINWSHDSNLHDTIATNLTAGVYTVAVTDANNCMASYTDTITNQPFLDFMISETTETSCVAATGVIIISGDGGVYPYQYTWSHDASLNDSIAENLPTGTYDVTITDSRNCQIILSAEIETANGPMLSVVDSTNSSCGLSNGSLILSSGAGTPPYNYSWSHDASLSDSAANNLAEGVYTITVTDANGCTDQVSVMIGGSPAVALILDSAMDESCDTQNGVIQVSATGGTAPFSYSWSHDATINSDMASGLTAGSYTITVTGAFGCTDTLSVTINSTPEVNAVIVASNDNTCAQSNGAITVGATSGTPPFAYTWSHDASLTDSVAQQLVGGMYIVTITDANGCSDIVSQTIQDLPALSAVVVQIDSSNCEPGTGSITITATDGVGGYSYAWIHDTSLNSNQANGLSAGNYSVTVTDTAGCAVSLTADVPNFASPQFAGIDVQPALCDSATGSITLTPSGGLPPYTYIWSHDLTLNGPVATGLAAGIYEFQITDARNCTAVDFVTVSSSSDIDINLISAVRPACNMSDGSLEIEVVGGTSPYTIQWFDAADLSVVIGSNFIINDLDAGDYVVEVADANGCTDQNIYSLIEVDPITLIALGTDETCFYADDGSASVAVLSGGTIPFDFLWDDPNASTSSTIAPLAADVYRVTVTDARGCTSIDSAVVAEPDEISIDTSIVSPSCLSPETGSIFVDASGGVAPYVYLWPNQDQSGPNLTLVPAGTYQLVVVDSTACQSVFDIDIPTFEDITVTSDEINPPACDGSFGGNATVEITGGQTPYSYAWNDGLNQSTPTATDLSPGIYMVIVADAGGCSDTLEIEIPDVLGLSISETDLINPLCHGDANGELEVDATGGSGNYDYLWDDLLFQTTSRAVGLSAGRYIVRVTDLDLGCVNRDTFFLIDPDGLQIDSITTTTVACFGGEDAHARVYASGGTGDLSYLWSDSEGQMTELAENLTAGFYQVTVTDENNCIASGMTEVLEPSGMEITIADSAAISCFGESDGFIRIGIDGGNPPYSINWPQLGVMGDSVSNLNGSSYIVEVTDDSGCFVADTVSLHEPTAVTINLVSLMNAACSAGQMGSITVEGQGGEGPYTYLWDDAIGQITPTAFNLDSGNYSVIVTDTKGCSDTMTYTITGQAELGVELIDSMLPLCFGDQNGSLSVSVTGGNDDYVYLWNDPAFQATPTAVNLFAGEYILFVSNADGTCPTRDTITLLQPDQLFVPLVNVSDVLCFGQDNGTAWIEVAGGVMPYQIDWLELGLDLGDSVGMLAAGDYHLSISDANGCVLDDTIAVSEPEELILSAEIQDPVCFGDENGSITINVNGGTAPFMYAWSAPVMDTTAMIGNLASGAYAVTAVDAHGCTDELNTQLIDQSELIELAVLELMDPSCIGADNGLLSVTASGGGDGSFNYMWSNGGAAGLIDGLLPDIYSVTVSDGFGCSIDSTFDLSQVADLDLQLDITDTLICLGQMVTVGVATIPGATYMWSGPDGFSNSDSMITVGASGDYTVTAAVSICSESATVSVLNSTSVLQTQFIIPSQVVVGDTIVALESSWPIPNDVQWTYNSDSVEFVFQNQNQWIFTFPYTGTFDIGLSASVGECSSFIEKTIVVHPDSSTFIIPPSQGNKQILNYTVSPNPTPGFFMVDFELQFNMPYYFRLYRIDGTPIENRQGNGVGSISETFNLGAQANGLYVVSLQSGEDLVWSILKIERP